MNPLIDINKILQELLKLNDADRAVVVDFLKRVRLDPAKLPKAPTTSREDMKRNVSVIRRGPREPEDGMGTLTSGGTPPEEFWRRGDPDAAALDRRPMRGGRRWPVTR